MWDDSLKKFLIRKPKTQRYQTILKRNLRGCMERGYPVKPELWEEGKPPLYHHLFPL